MSQLHNLYAKPANVSTTANDDNVSMHKLSPGLKGSGFEDTNKNKEEIQGQPTSPQTRISRQRGDPIQRFSISDTTLF